VPAATRACPRVPPQNLNGKEGIDGSSPSEGLRQNPCNCGCIVACVGAPEPRGYETGTHFGDGGHSRTRATSGVVLRHGPSLPWSCAILESPCMRAPSVAVLDKNTNPSLQRGCQSRPLQVQSGPGFGQISPTGSPSASSPWWPRVLLGDGERGVILLVEEDVALPGLALDREQDRGLGRDRVRRTQEGKVPDL